MYTGEDLLQLVIEGGEDQLNSVNHEIKKAQGEGQGTVASGANELKDFLKAPPKVFFLKKSIRLSFSKTCKHSCKNTLP